MNRTAEIQCARALVAEVSRNFPTLKEHIARKEYEQAYDLLLKPRADHHYDSGGNQGIKFFYLGPLFSVDYQLLMQALQEKNAPHIEGLSRSLETILKQREMRRQTHGENFDFEDD